ncbi:uncharacterized protein K444DRAFT_621365 [Hyaloscypha bicolor E]|uniref:Nephrocystin 3-like N-terminal domain-containing protein n=1 Tax=Hyaloscypha bicolor E TaxID=1095630 RepID=A0A2J6SN60_9HELO|nr:uncharacterized protein K444DRAFT_621365 [Hyaloscypha bicolor E]PMD52221.1 hypothetical protein K444DRAFT_621365 [Hyaloscypha bicolor E]
MPPLFKKQRTEESQKDVQPTPLEESNENSTEGLFELRGFHSKLSGGRKVDIIAIHGLNGDPYKTWTSDNVIWFSQLLPQFLLDFDLRISTFGYNSRVAFGGSSFQIRDYAMQLLAQLHLKRKISNTTGVPMVFLCHSLGGIILKKFLIVAHERNSIYSDINICTAGVMFMGTPHIGSDVAKWTRVIRNIGNFCTFGSFRTDLLKGLESKSTELAEISAQFVERGKTIQIISVYEGRPLLAIIPVIVERESALLNVANEMPLPLDADHREICRFSNPNDPRYNVVVLAVANLIKNIMVLGGSERQACLDALYFGHYRERRLRVSQAYPGTLTWIWNHPQYQQWEESPSSTLLWLQGKPGSGKSTLANHLRSQLIHRLLHIHDAQCLIADFFYSARGGDDQQGHIWMLRSILYQILLRAPALWEDYREAFEGYKQSQEWNIPSLLQIFLSLGTRYNQNVPLRIHIIVDAMDESEEDMRQETIKMLHRVSNQNINSNVVFKIFVASRPNPKISFALRNCRYMKLEDEIFNDIVEYVQGETKRIAVEVLQYPPEDLQVVSQTLIFRSKGVFLWVKLVLAELEERAIEGLCTMAEIEDLTTSIPMDLEDLYCRIVEEIVKKNEAAVRECQTLLRWVAYSPQPLDVEQIREILAVSLCDNSDLSETQISRHRVRNAEELRKRIASRCGNLLEVRHGVVQFVHQTTREYMLHKIKPAAIQLEEWASKIEIGRLCKRYLDYFNLTIDAVRTSSNLSRTGVGWASSDLKRYVALIEFRQPVLVPFCLDSYRLYVEQHTTPSLELKEVTRDFLTTLESTYQLLDGATLASLIHGDDASLRTIIRAPEQVNRLIPIPADLQSMIHLRAESFPGSSRTRYWSPLQFAVCLKFKADHAIKILLRLGADPNFSDETGQTPLFQAVEMGSSVLSYTLISTTMRCSFDDADGADPEDIFQNEPSAHGTDYDEVDFFPHYPWAQSTHPARARPRPKPPLLSADPMISDHAGRSPLSIALENHHYEIARGLLVRAQRRGFVTAATKGLSVHNYLYNACQTGNARAFDILADFTTNWNFQDDDRRTLMHVAAANGHQEIVFRLVLRTCLNLDWTDKEGLTALELAVLNQHQNIAKILREKGTTDSKNRRVSVRHQMDCT